MKKMEMEGRDLLRTDVLWRAAVEGLIEEDTLRTMEDCESGVREDEKERVESDEGSSQRAWDVSSLNR